jgi:hypothetical protein
VLTLEPEPAAACKNVLDVGRRWPPAEKLSSESLLSLRNFDSSGPLEGSCRSTGTSLLLVSLDLSASLAVHQHPPKDSRKDLVTIRVWPTLKPGWLPLASLAPSHPAQGGAPWRACPFVGFSTAPRIEAVPSVPRESSSKFSRNLVHLPSACPRDSGHA